MFPSCWAGCAVVIARLAQVCFTSTSKRIFNVSALYADDCRAVAAAQQLGSAGRGEGWEVVPEQQWFAPDRSPCSIKTMPIHHNSVAEILLVHLNLACTYALLFVRGLVGCRPPKQAPLPHQQRQHHQAAAAAILGSSCLFG